MATNTYVAIATQTLISNTATVTFSSIPSTYTDLVLVAVVKNSSTLNNGRFFFNNDTSALYSGTYLQGNGSAASTGRVSNVNSCYTPEISTTDWTIITANIMNYSNTTTFKSTIIRGGTASDRTAEWVDLYRSTNAISRLDFETFGGNLVAGSTFSLYGITAEGVSPTPKATGGAIYSDDLYYYHAFGSSGVFAPTTSISADILVVAGGGCGGGFAGGGGGAGGLLGFGSQSLTATNYAITVGAGGAGIQVAYNAGGGNNGSNSQFGGLTAAVGGGFGAPTGNIALGVGSGGSGGGRGNPSGPGSGTTGQGFNGGSSGSDTGGGGGAGAIGTVANGGTGGIGATFNTLVGGTAGPYSFINAMGAATGTGELSGGNYYFAGGGGGGCTGPAQGGIGGGGGGLTSGRANSGGGGGGACGATSFSGSGGSGVVIVRYLKA